MINKTEIEHAEQGRKLNKKVTVRKQKEEKGRYGEREIQGEDQKKTAFTGSRLPAQGRKKMVRSCPECMHDIEQHGRDRICSKCRK